MTSQRKNILAWGVFSVFLIYIWGLKSFSFHWETGDEAIYVYLSWAFLDHGALPYKDYFFAHPPLQILWAVPHFALFGFNPISVKTIPLISLSLTSLLLFLIGLKKLGRTGAIVTALSFLSAYTLLRSTGFWTGIHESILWATFGLWLFFQEKPLLSGVALALGVGTGTYILPAALLVGALCFIRDSSQGKKFSFGFLLVWGILQIMGLLLGGKSYWQGVYAYHFQKPEAKQPAWRDSLLHFFENFTLFSAGLVGFFIAFFEQLKKLKKSLQVFLFENEKASVALIGAIWALGYIAFLHLLNKRFSFYYNLCMLGFALGAGFLAQDLVDYVKSHFKKDRKNRFFSENLIYPLLTTSLLLIGYLSHQFFFKTYFPKVFRSKDQEMKWVGSPIPLANSFFKWCCWDSMALAGKRYGTAKELLYRQTDLFQSFNQLSDYVYEHSSKKDKLFGDSISAGILAVLSKRQLIQNFADTNTMRFTSGATKPEEAISEIDRPDLKFVLVTGSPKRDAKTGQISNVYLRFASLVPFRRWLDNNFRLVLQVPLGSGSYFYLLERNRWPSQL